MFIAGAAQATINYTAYDFSSTFTLAVFGTPDIPFKTLTGSMTVSYDDATDTYGLAAFSMDIGAYHFDMSNTAMIYTDPVSPLIGGTQSGVNYMGQSGSEDDRPDFLFYLDYDSGNVTGIDGFSYEVPGVFDYFAAAPGTVSDGTPTDAPPPVPEPASWALMLCGFGAIGAAMRSAKRVTTSFA